MLPILLTFNFPGKSYGAGGETRTRDPNLGKVVLYQLSYTRVSDYCLRLEDANITNRSFIVN